MNEGILDQIARAILGVDSDQAVAELESGEISDTPAGEAFEIVRQMVWFMNHRTLDGEHTEWDRFLSFRNATGRKPDEIDIQAEILNMESENRITYSRCHECNERKVDPDEFYDGLICTDCAERREREQEEDDAAYRDVDGGSW